ncbi:MAG: TIGR02099 family protein [Azonexaceae bacterium]|nr:TIGR02099 family protein [Azonexaceae bacterium]
MRSKPPIVVTSFRFWQSAARLTDSRPPSLTPPSPEHAALYYRLRGPRAWLARPPLRRALRLLGWATFAGWLAFVALLLVLRYLVLPGVADYRGDIERLSSEALGQPIAIGRLAADWHGLNPELVLDEVSVLDREANPALTLAQVRVVLSWHSLWRLRPIFSLLAIEQPVLQIRRGEDGRISVAGIEPSGNDDPAALEWLLEQKRIRIRDATVVWEDALRGAPPLILEDLQFGLDNSGRRHRFGLSAAPPAALAARIDLRGEVHGDLHDAFEHYAGKLFLELGYADLAGWRAWIDYPVDLPQGRGALRVWGDLDDGQGQLTADVALEDVHLRLGKRLPMLDLLNLRGRLEGRYRANDWSVAGQRLELSARDGTRLVPTDFRLDWQQRGAAVDGKAQANLLDLGVLARLAAYLPLDDGTRQRLATHAPEGRLSDLRASWSYADQQLGRYALNAGFMRLGLRADGAVPGGSGLSGSIEATEKGGRLKLDSEQADLSLPSVFPEPNMSFDTLNGSIRWQHEAGGSGAWQVDIERLAFAGGDATGETSGSYRYDGNGPGVIDLRASIDKARGDAVWRYMPHAVNVDARMWLKHGIVSGTARDARLVLKGDLRHFPFRDPSTGQFLVTARAVDTRIDYAEGWPLIDQVDADMRFGVGMEVRAHKGRILGAQLGEVKVVIPDFESDEEMLLVRGGAHGPTAEFLKFVERSPVAASIDHFTEGMKANGNGKLDLDLDIPLRHALDTKVVGTFHFLDNQLMPIDGLPFLTQVNGRLHITEQTVSADNISGRGFGGPFRVDVKSQGSQVAILATGTASIGEVNRHFGWPLLGQLSGSTPWKAEIGVQKRNASVVITSDLLGISSPLPDALNKSATARLPLRIERQAPAANVEQYRITLGKVAQGLMVRRDGRWAQGVFSVGDSDMSLPARGLAVRIQQPVVDVDAWRPYLDSATPAGATPAAATDGDGMAFAEARIRTPRLRLLGQDYSDVDTLVRPSGVGWQITLESRQAAGELFWRGAGDGWLEGRFRRLLLNRAMTEGKRDNVIDSLPGMNLVVDQLRLDDKTLGRLELQARNQGGNWLLDKLRLANPDGELKGKGRWQRGAQQQTQLDFELDVADIGKLLTRLGYADAVRAGKATLNGNLRWNGALTAIHYPSLAGNLGVHAEKGQFNKLEPGVGRLLGLISLQSIPRRLSLDFRDLFSDGLAFDSIDAKLRVEGGVMRTVEDMKMNGPAVQVLIAGHTDLQRETQDLQVTVRPEISNLAAVGVAVINPVAGAAALVASTVLQNPLNRLFAYRYHVTGSWDDPQVDKSAQDNAAPPPAQEKP